MKIDLSTLVMVVLVIIPGLFAQRARDLMIPRALIPKGASEELAELVALGVATNGLLIVLVSVVWLILGIIFRLGAVHYFSAFDRWIITPWIQTHLTEAALAATGYVFASFFAGHCLGVVYGAVSSEGRLTARILGKMKWLERLGFQGLLGERPIIYELLNAESDSDGRSKILFIEAEMKSGAGFYSGQLSQFAIVRDEEPHRPIYVIEPWYKSSRDDQYTEVQADGILLDLADVTCLLIKQMEQPE